MRGRTASPPQHLQEAVPSGPREPWQWSGMDQHLQAGPGGAGRGPGVASVELQPCQAGLQRTGVIPFSLLCNGVNGVTGSVSGGERGLRDAPERPGTSPRPSCLKDKRCTSFSVGQLLGKRAPAPALDGTAPSCRPPWGWIFRWGDGK